MSKIDEALKALEQVEQLKQEAIQELLAGRREIDAQLAKLGYQPEAPARRKSSKVPYCKICNIEGHDGRSHRGQDPQRPFTKEELENLR